MTEHAESVADELPEPSGAGRVRVVGTAHVSEHSVEEVRERITEDRPDIVAVELDEGRYRQMQGETPDDLDASDLLRGNTVFQFLAYWMLSYIQARMGDRFDIEPGADMKAAIETAEEHGLGVALVDRNIQTTVQRFWSRLTAVEKLKLVGSLMTELGPPLTVGLTIGAVFGVMAAVVSGVVGWPVLVSTAVAGPLASVLNTVLVGVLMTAAIGVPIAAFVTQLHSEEDIEEFDIEQLTDTDVVSAMMEEFRRFSPGGAEALIDERDAYIAHRLVGLREAGYDVVAVVGAGHREGIERYLANPEELPPMESLTGTTSGGRFSVYKLLGYAMTLGFLVFFVLLVMAGVNDAFLLRLFGAWFLINGVIAAALARLAGAHWTSSLVGGGVAWMTSVNPLLAPGWFAGYVELRYISVNVGDIATLNEILADEESPILDLIQRLRSVPLFRLIMIVALTNIGSMIASFLFATVLLPYFSQEIGGVDGVARLMVRGARNSADLLWGVVR
ncbi:TraB/GumN family protein [Haloarcula pelagica]|uniref:TraB/GumN family protein n=1 Tax=Haloarcula pelagica TaxID=3033389 RepID=UPI0024C2A437|nr:TraB/GumN family protein [Halomicroarcula sp. YJ-61-S]